MIKNKRKSNFPIPSSLINAAADLERIAGGDKSLISDAIYKGEYKDKNTGKIRYEVRETLKKIYYNKCAYCEIKEYKPEIEHYRPKKRVTGQKKHPGYYWLCYEWSNLLPSCRYCNTEGGKGNHFPIKGKRVGKPPLTRGDKLIKEKCRADRAPLKKEEPYLLHPEVDSPEDLFSFRRNGRIVGADKKNRGRRTIRICNLNRENLLYRRQKIVDNIKEELEDAFLVYFDVNQSEAHLMQSLKRIFVRMEEAAAPQCEFSLMSLYCLTHFDTLVAPLLGTPTQRAFAAKAFSLYKSRKL